MLESKKRAIVCVMARFFAAAYGLPETAKSCTRSLSCHNPMHSWHPMRDRFLHIVQSLPSRRHRTSRLSPTHPVSPIRFQTRCANLRNRRLRRSAILRRNRIRRLTFVSARAVSW